MPDDPIYRITSIGRPIDPAYPTNRAVVWLAPLAGLVGALAGIERGEGLVGTTIAAAIAVLGAFGSWALTRELAPDDDPAAFVSMVASLGAIWIFERPGVLVLFATMGLVRIVNRTVGLPPRRTDSVVVLLFALVVAWITPSPWFALVAAVAFAADARLPAGRREGLAFAGIALVGAIVVLLATDAPIASYELPSGPLGPVLLVVSVLYVLLLVRTRSVKSVGDVDGIPLEPARVRTAMAIGLLAALSGPTAETAAYVWSAIAGTAIAGLRRLR